MTTFARTVAVALTLGLTSGLVYFAPTFADELSHVSVLDSDTSRGISSMSASQKVRCIMPPAWRQACGA
jgi:hypothetical protein